MDKLEISLGFLTMNAQGTTAIAAAFVIVLLVVSLRFSGSSVAKRVSRGAAAAGKPVMPGFIKPQLATLKSKAPVGSQWLHEIKYDAYRVQVHINAGRKKV